MITPAKLLGGPIADNTVKIVYNDIPHFGFNYKSVLDIKTKFRTEAGSLTQKSNGNCSLNTRTKIGYNDVSV